VIRSLFKWLLAGGAVASLAFGVDAVLRWAQGRWFPDSEFFDPFSPYSFIFKYVVFIGLAFIPISLVSGLIDVLVKRINEPIR